MGGTQLRNNYLTKPVARRALRDFIYSAGAGVTLAKSTKSHKKPRKLGIFQ